LVDAITLDPAIITDSYSSEIAYNIYDGLVSFDSNSLSVAPALAIKWKTIDNGKTWIFDLRKGVKFSDGTSFTAAAVVNSYYKRFQKDRKQYSEVEENIKRVEAINEYKVKIILREADYGFIKRILDVPYLISLNKTGKNGEIIRLGTGPFYLKKWKKGEYIILNKNRFYWGKKVKIDSVIIKIVNSSYEKILKFQNGYGDLLRINSKKEENYLLSKKKVNYFENKSLLIYYLGFNIKKKPFNNLLVRKAFAKLINKKRLVNYVFQNTAIPSETFVPYFVEGVNKDVHDYKFDLSGAKMMLNKAGYKDGFTFTLLIREASQDVRELAAYIGRIALKVGIKVRIKEFSYVDLVKQLKKENFDAYIAGFVTPPDPELFLEPNFLINGSFNRRGYKDIEINNLLKKARSSTGEKRKKLYYKIQKKIHQDIPLIPLFLLKSKVISKKNIFGIEVSPLGIILFKDIYIKNGVN
jgi:peptide/nickel transport system substrate-binding protein